MDNNAIITVKGNQSLNNDSSDIEIITEGIFKKSESGYTIQYNETEMTGFEGTTTTLNVSDGSVTLIRTGSNNSSMIFEKGQKYMGHYETPYGSFTIGIISNKVNIDLTDSGGNIQVGYLLEIDNLVTSTNSITLSIREL